MNLKKAKAIRKIVGFVPSADRIYMDVPRKKDKEGNIVRSQKVAQGARQRYQWAKKTNDIGIIEQAIGGTR